MSTQGHDWAKHVSQCLELAILLESAAHKPGNISIVTNFDGTRYEHFLASAVATAPHFETLAERGKKVIERRISFSELEIGRTIKACVNDIGYWQRGGNTLLGTVILLSPIAAAAGMIRSDKSSCDLLTLRRNIKLVLESTTSSDAVDVYEAIAKAKPSGLNQAPELDVNDLNSRRRITQESISLFEVFKIAAGYDDVCSEWVNNYPITFDLAYPYLLLQLKTHDINVATTHTFLKVLAARPDTFITRKVGLGKSKQVSFEAEGVVGAGALDSVEGRVRLEAFDRRLRESGNTLNPGTTADIISSTLALLILGGFRP